VVLVRQPTLPAQTGAQQPLLTLSLSVVAVAVPYKRTVRRALLVAVPGFQPHLVVTAVSEQPCLAKRVAIVELMITLVVVAVRALWD
jgi:hypothetical protein